MQKDLLISWLNDAYAMERALLPILKNHARDAEAAMPEATARIRQHVDETQTHAQRAEECLRILGATPSGVKWALGAALGTAQSVMTGMFSDEMVKHALTDYSTEQFEVGFYTALIAAAEGLGEREIARLCGESLRDDQRMAAWLEEKIPMVVAQTIARRSATAGG
jgi:ferritin-like metal-binding protein YciE